MFVAKENFTDLKSKHEYQKDDIFPFKNETIDKSRIKELSTNENRLNKPLIEKKKLMDLSISQLVEFATIMGIDVKSVLLDVINSKNVNSIDKN